MPRDLFFIYFTIELCVKCEAYFVVIDDKLSLGKKQEILLDLRHT